MAAETSSPALKSGYFVIADISGYTSFIVNNDLAHAQGILSEIVDLIITHLPAPFQFIELEGDAVFVFAPAEAVEDSERLVEIIEVCYAAFRRRIEQMVNNTVCECTACRAIPELDLKCVAHYGQYVPQPTPTGTKLVGADVVLTHRLLKNEVIERTSIRAYAFLTDAFVQQSQQPERGLGLPEHAEEYPELGVIQGRILDLSASVERLRETHRRFISAADADFELAAELPAARSYVWGYLIEPKRRLRWQLDTIDADSQPGAHGRAGVGWQSHCDHGNYRMDHRIVDWQPFDYITMDTVSSGKSLTKPPSCIATFSLEEISEASCRLRLRVRAKRRGLLMQGLMTLAKPMIRREWSAHFATLSGILLADLAKADDA